MTEPSMVIWLTNLIWFLTLAE